MTPTLDVLEVMHDERSPTVFHVYPPNNGSGALTLLVGAIPFIALTTSGLYPLNSSTVAIPIPENYKQAIIDGLCSKALAAQTRRQDITKAQLYWQKFEGGIIASKSAIPDATPELTTKDAQ
jgi:hypothetical protein